MKAQLYDTIQTLVDINADFDHRYRIILKGTEGTIVECYENPELYAVDLAIPNDKLVGGFEYENVILNPTQFTTLVNSVEMGEYSYFKVGGN
ncbi:hypothetical protein [Kamptonema sp. UHCC 0994]|uniref:hypothetical protein n=1 Tax=Kamptonema sp. UHCC 0994 TaxID=3031329 RepID=UPI0023B8A6A3|nr:hypothetical protein [Kamptonema sp. UHCC 0994]MDF0555332.1 hypothetical protein [Kamptonema sp. UHCC 0994]